MRIAIKTLGELMITLGVFLLLFLVWQLWWTDIEANAEAEDILDSTLETFASGSGVNTSSGGNSPSEGGDSSPNVNESSDNSTGAGPDLVAEAIVHLPTIGEVRPVMSGVELSVLNQGVLGQYPDSEDPGEVGNFAMAGHRTTYGRPLWAIGELSPGDPIVVETQDDYFIYRFERTQIVSPSATQVIADVPGDPGAVAVQKWMVMTACHPKFSAAQRIVAFNSFDYEQPRSQGRPAELEG